MLYNSSVMTSPPASVPTFMRNRPRYQLPKHIDNNNDGTFMSDYTPTVVKKRPSKPELVVNPAKDGKRTPTPPRGAHRGQTVAEVSVPKLALDGDELDDEEATPTKERTSSRSSARSAGSRSGEHRSPARSGGYKSGEHASPARRGNNRSGEHISPARGGSNRSEERSSPVGVGGHRSGSPASVWNDNPAVTSAGGEKLWPRERKLSTPPLSRLEITVNDSFLPETESAVKKRLSSPPAGRMPTPGTVDDSVRKQRRSNSSPDDSSSRLDCYQKGIFICAS